MKVAVLILFSIFSVTGNFSSLPSVNVLPSNAQELTIVAEDSSNISSVDAGLILCDVSVKIICEAGRISSNIILSISDLIKTNKSETEIFAANKGFNSGDNSSGLKYISNISRFTEKVKRFIADFNNKYTFNYKNVSRILNVTSINSFIYKLIHSKKHHTVKINLGNSDDDYFDFSNKNITLDIKKAFGYTDCPSAFFIFNNTKKTMEIMSI